MSTQDTVFYSNNQAFLVDFTGENISSEGGTALLAKTGILLINNGGILLMNSNNECQVLRKQF